MAKKKIGVNVMLTRWLKEQVEAIAKIEDRSVSAQVRLILTAWLNSKGITEGENENETD